MAVTTALRGSPAPPQTVTALDATDASANEDKNVPSNTIKVKKPNLKHATSMQAAASPSSQEQSHSPINVGGDKVICKHCKKAFDRSLASLHTKQCLKAKQERMKKKKETKEHKETKAIGDSKDKAKEIGEDPTLDADSKPDQAGKRTPEKIKTLKENVVKELTDGNAKAAKKRKADGDGEKVAKKQKKKDEPKAKVPKTKGPVDVEKQCGVRLPNGLMCARSLTCKSHAMGAKRAVPGRSLPYDILLAQYQKKNQAKQQKAAIDANAPLQDDVDAAGSGPIDSDEERDAIMAGIARARPLPLAIKPLLASRAKYQHIRMKEMLHNALGGSRGAGIFSTASGDILRLSLLASTNDSGQLLDPASEIYAKRAGVMPRGPSSTTVVAASLRK